MKREWKKWKQLFTVNSVTQSTLKIDFELFLLRFIPYLIKKNQVYVLFNANSEIIIYDL